MQAAMLYYARNHAVGKPYRRIIMGSTFYFAYTDTTLNVAVFDQADVNPTTFLNPLTQSLLGVVTGLLISDALLQSIVAEAMAAEAAP
jgi:hypothetical protein